MATKVRLINDIHKLFFFFYKKRAIARLGTMAKQKLFLKTIKIISNHGCEA